MGSVVCCFHLVQLGEDVVSVEKKAMLLYGEYLPFAIIRKSEPHLPGRSRMSYADRQIAATIMAVDMYSRLLARIDRVEDRSKKQ